MAADVTVKCSLQLELIATCGTDELNRAGSSQVLVSAELSLEQVAAVPWALEGAKDWIAVKKKQVVIMW